MFEIKIMLFLITFLFFHANCQVVITYPEDFKHKITNENGDIGYLDYSLATFGEVPYGSTLNVPLKIPNAKQIEGCETFNLDIDSNLIFGLVMKRGNCTFATKAYYSQMVGAEIAVIVNTKDKEDLNSIVPIDDGNHPSVRIPLIVINKAEGEKIMDLLESGKSVELAISFDIPSISDGITVDIWVSPSDKDSYEFIYLFEPYVKLLESDSDVIFNINYQVLSLSYQLDSSNPIHKDCYGKGKYCAFDPDNEGPLNGTIILDQILIHKCVDSHFQNKNDRFGWWKFGKQFYENCLTFGDFSQLTNCSYKILEDIQLENKNDEIVNYVQDCVKNSFSDPLTKSTSDNKLLAKEQKKYIDNNIFIIPSLMINNIFYRGNLVAPSLFSTICETIGNPNENVQLMCFNQVYVTENNNYLWLLIALGVLLGFIFVISIAIYRHIVKRDFDKTLKIEIDAAVTHYMKMNDFSINQFDQINNQFT